MSIGTGESPIERGGIGIDQDKLTTIFEPFTQEDEGVLALGMGVFLSFFNDRNLPRNYYCSTKICSFTFADVIGLFFSELS